MRRLLVTGGAGFIGSNFVHHVLRGSFADRLVVLDALTYAGNLANLAPVTADSRLRFVRGDICDRPLVEGLLREEGIDTIVHFAAESHVDRSIAAPDVFVRTNVLGTHTLLEAARVVWLDERAVTKHRFHHVSTDEVYGSLGPQDAPFTESTPYAPSSPYSASKAAADHLVRAYALTYGLRASLSNCSNNYGPFHFPEKLVPLVIVNILQGRPIPLYGDGRNIRDWIYVEDHCRGIELVLANEDATKTFNIGGRAEHENLEIVERLCGLADELFQERPALRAAFPESPAARGEKSSSLVRFVKDRPGHDRRCAIDCDRIEGELGFRPAVSLAEGLRRTFLWYLDNVPWWRNVMNGSYRNWIRFQYEGRPPVQG
jgi:dTDP-glucose 4,6-dehydratase